MINECESVKANAKKVQDMGVPQVPMLLFISDGSGGTGFDKETWRRIPEEYISQVDNGKYEKPSGLEGSATTYKGGSDGSISIAAQSNRPALFYKKSTDLIYPL